MINKAIFKGAKMAQVAVTTAATNKGEGRRGGIFDYPSGTSFYKPHEGANTISIIPYVIQKIDNIPYSKGTKLGNGDPAFCYTVAIHKYIGPSRQDCVCLTQYGKACPICEERKRLAASGMEKEANELGITNRVFYNVEDQSEPGKVKIFEAPRTSFAKELDEETYAQPESAGVPFNLVHPDDKRLIAFRGQKENRNGIEYLSYKGFNLQHTQTPVADSLYEQTVCFDGTVKIPSYQEACDILYGEKDKTPETQPATYVAPVQPVVQATPAYTTVTPVQPVAPVVSTPVAPVAPVTPVYTSTAPVSPAPVVAGGCPHGHTFGVSCDSTEDCANCTIWETCLSAKPQ